MRRRDVVRVRDVAETTFSDFGDPEEQWYTTGMRNARGIAPF